MKMAAGSLQSSTVLHAWACSLCKLQAYTRGTGGYGTLTLLKQQVIPALKALKCIKNTGQTSTGFRTRRVWPQVSGSPDAEQCRAQQGTLHQLLYWCSSSFTSSFSPLRWGAEHLFSPQSLGTSIYTLTWLLHLSLLYLLKEQMGKLRFWIFLGTTRDIGDELGGTYCPWETEVEPVPWNRDYPSDHYEEPPHLFLKPWCLCYILIQSEQQWSCLFCGQWDLTLQ